MYVPLCALEKLIEKFERISISLCYRQKLLALNDVYDPRDNNMISQCVMCMIIKLYGEFFLLGYRHAPL